jgi:hypothetical protein
MDKDCKELLDKIGIHFDSMEQLDGQMIERTMLLDKQKYETIQDKIPNIKQIFSSSIFTSLQKPAPIHQKWPLLNLVRQILHGYGFIMEPIRKSDGYTKEGIKKCKRYFLIKYTMKKTM